MRILAIRPWAAIALVAPIVSAQNELFRECAPLMQIVDPDDRVILLPATVEGYAPMEVPESHPMHQLSVYYPTGMSCTPFEDGPYPTLMFSPASPPAALP